MEWILSGWNIEQFHIFIKNFLESVKSLRNFLLWNMNLINNIIVCYYYNDNHKNKFKFVKGWKVRCYNVKTFRCPKRNRAFIHHYSISLNYDKLAGSMLEDKRWLYFCVTLLQIHRIGGKV
jgi:hypothetical protein